MTDARAKCTKQTTVVRNARETAVPIRFRFLPSFFLSSFVASRDRSFYKGLVSTTFAFSFPARVFVSLVVVRARARGCGRTEVRDGRRETRRLTRPNLSDPTKRPEARRDEAGWG